MATWSVTSQVSDQVKVTDAGQTVEGVMVYFVTGEGNSGSVFVPDSQYTASKVRQMIGHRAAVLDEVGALASASE